MKTPIAILLPAAFLAGSLLMGQQIKNVQPAPTAPGNGQAMFVQYCASCHGPDGKGSGPAAGALKKKPADLTALASHNKGVYPAQDVVRYIKGVDQIAAHGSRSMPVWGNIFEGMHPNDPDLVAIRVNVLADYVKSLQSK